MLKLHSFLSLFVLVLLANTKQIRLVCQTVATSQCASGYRFRALGTSLDVKYCLPVGQTCSTTYDNTLQANTCTKDYKNNVCTVGVCYTTSALSSVCSKDFVNCTAAGDVYGYSCVTCGTIAGCNKCFIGQKNGAVNTAEVCLGSTCNSIVSVNATVKQCNSLVDAWGFSCSCCVATDQAVNACASDNPALSLTTVLDWVKGTNTNANNTTTGGFEPSMQMFLGMLLLLGMFMMF